ncbi:MAG: hypothetical protein DMF29_05880 [Verrucomicrobia bacterium]|nr:MAG: hypothetical protein DMF29_05880 [Verrucomicrobiota bacterium]
MNARSDQERTSFLAVARCDGERIARHVVFPAVQPKLALLDCPDTANRCDLVFGGELATALVAKLVIGLRRRNCFFHIHVQLAGRARRFVSKLFSARTLFVVVDLSRDALRVLGLVHRIN